MRRFVSLVLALVAFSPLTLAGCSDSSTQPTTSLEGTYVLTSFDGAPPPVVLQATDPKFEVVSDEIAFITSGSFTQTTQFRVTTGGVESTESDVEMGTYEVRGSIITFHFATDNSTANATLSGTTFTVASGGHTILYSRR